MPYGVQEHSAQQFGPPPTKRPGSVSTKVFGVLLLVAALFEIFSFVSSLPGVAGGFTGTEFNPTISTEAKEDIDRLVRELVAEQTSHWSYWPGMIGVAVLAVCSIASAFALLIKPRPIGRKLAIAAGTLGLLALPIYGVSSQAEVDSMMHMQSEIMRISTDDAIRQEKARNPTISDKELEERRRVLSDMMEGMAPAMKIGTYAVLVVMAIGVLVFNCLLLFFMTRPGVEGYLAEAARGKDSAIPQYDPSMGIMVGPTAQPQPPQPPPPNPPQIPPV
jgi:hypothetical protein